jgi:multimeric flavodoxin WrbA
MRKIIGISASSRVWGNCETSVKQVLTAAMKEGARARFVRLTDMDIRACKGCFRCLGEGGRCTLGDDLYNFLDEVKGADDIVLASPVYFMSAPAALIGLLDRLLAVCEYMAEGEGRRRAVTLTLMGNGEWRGVAMPFVNITASLLGFEIMESLGLVAEGPGEVITRPAIARSLAAVGRALARGEPWERPEAGRFCPVCRSDFFRVEPELVICPVCGLEGDLAAYITEGVFKPAGEPARWGQRWLREHVDSWIRPSVVRYAGDRREILKELRSLKAEFRGLEEGGKLDV